MATLRDEIDKIIDYFAHQTFENYMIEMDTSAVREYNKMIDDIMDEVDKDKEAMCEECPGNHLRYTYFLKR